MMNVLPLIDSCLGLLSEGFRGELRQLWAEEHLSKIGERLGRWWRDGVPAEPPPPRFAAEVVRPLEEVVAPFRPVLGRWEAAGHTATPEVLAGLAAAVEAVGCPGLLRLLGQRLTPASVTDARAIPPTRSELLAAADEVHHPASGLTVCARALAKHAHRSPDAFWGTPRGPVAVQNAGAHDKVASLIDGATWWNVFGHFQHELAFEVRVPSGHGARWSHPEGEFIGFLEPFAEELCPSLNKDADGQP
jgi:hypothetical protein